MKYLILIPAYEPDNKLLTLLDEIPKKYPIIIVNDGSNHNYDYIFEAAKQRAYVISYKENRGKGYALKKGLEYIKDTYQNNYIVVTMDADGQHKIEDALKLCDYAKANQDTMVLGKRTWDKQTPLRSRIGNRITRNVFRRITKENIYDTQTGLRAFSANLIEYMLSEPGERYEYEMNVLLDLKKHNIKYHEINVATIYLDNNKSSHFNTIKDSYKIYKVIYKWKKNN